MIIALTGKSNVGKSHIASLFSNLGYKWLSFSGALKDKFPPLPQESNHEYKVRLSQVANRENVKDPTGFINPVLDLIRRDTKVVIDDLRTPMQLKLLDGHAEFFHQRLFIVRVESEQGISRSWMDEFFLPHDFLLHNNGLTDEEIYQFFAEFFHTCY